MIPPSLHWLPDPSPLPHVKVCGLTRLEDVVLAHDLGASLFGLIFARVSKRRIRLEEARQLVEGARERLGSHPPFIGVFVDEDPAWIARVQEELSLAAVQVHGGVEPLARHLPPFLVIPAVGISGEEDGRLLQGFSTDHPAVVADAAVQGRSGGTGQLFDHRHVLPHFSTRPILLAGGLSPENIGDVIGRLAPGPFPYGFDLSSGVEEAPGIKSAEKLRRFFDVYRRAFASIGRAR